MKQKLKKSLALLLTLAMCLSLFPMGVMATEDLSTWEKVAFEEIQSTDIIAITMTSKDGRTFVLPNTAKSASPAQIEGTVVGTTLTTDGVKATAASLSWNIVKDEGESTFAIYPKDETAVWLNPGNGNSNVRVGTTTDKTWILDNTYHYLKHVTTGRYLGVYTVGIDWRSYTTTPDNNNIKEQTLAFYKFANTAAPIQVAKPVAAPAGGDSADKATTLASGDTVALSCATAGAEIYYTTSTDGEPATPTKDSGTKYETPIEITADTGIKAIAIDPSSDAPLTDSEILTGYYKIATLVSVADARKATGSTVVTTKGTVTYIDGNSVYMQDATAGIVVRFGTLSKPSEVAVGKELTVTGTNSLYNGLLQLAPTAATVGGAGELPAPAAITVADLADKTDNAKTHEAMQVKLSGAYIANVDRSFTNPNVIVKDGSADSKSVQIYKSATLPANVYEGCTADILAVVDVNNNFQLRVTNTADYTMKSEPAKVANPVPSVESGESLKANDKVTFTCTTPGTTIQFNTEAADAAGEKWQPIPSGGLVMPDIMGDYKVFVRAIKESKENSDVLTLIYTVGQAAMTSIAEARKVAVGEQAYIKGVVVGDAGNSGIYIQDATAGICIMGKPASLALELGDEVTVRGYVKVFNGLVELDKKDDTHPITITKTGNANPPVITPASISVAMLNTGFYEGQLVKLTGVTLYAHGGTGGLKNHTIKQGATSATFRANLSDAFKQGDTLDIVGVASIYNTVQLIQQKSAADNGVTVGTPDLGTVGDPIERLVAWNAPGMTDGDPIPTEWPAVSGVNMTGAKLTVVGGVKLVKTSGRGYSSNTWNDGVGTKYWQIQFSTKGACDITVSATSASSGTGPSAFQVQYSLDGTNFFDLPGGALNLVYDKAGDFGSVTLAAAPLPPEAKNLDRVYIRWVSASNKQCKDPSKEVGSGATSQINGIIVSGNEYYGPGDVAPVKATPSSAAPVKLGTSISLASATAGAKIYYTTDDSQPTESSTPYTAPVVLNTLPATIKAVAYKDGKASLTTSVFEYTQIKMGDVSSNKLDNSPVSPTLDRITLTAEKGATIQYRITPAATVPAGSGNWLPYEGPIALTEEQFPVVLEARATAQGCLDSDVAVYHFTLSAGEPKNYFGQLHSHTTYSDGSGTLDSALDYILNTAKKNNVDFVSFTDHSNYLDGTASDGTKLGVNPAGSLYDMSLATPEAKAYWEGYKKKGADFNAAHGGEMLALIGFEMTWSGGPGHINTFNTPGVVSRNNADLNDKSNGAKDLGMQNYYSLLSQPEGATSISQFNHPGTTFGTFTEFSYWNPVIDQRICLVEAGNGEGAIGSGGYFPSYEEYTKALDKGWHVAPTNNQDNHKGHWGDANTARSVIYTNDFTEQGIYQAMKDRRVYSTEDRNLDIVYTVNDMIMGSTITEVPATLSVKGIISDPDSTDRISKVELIVNGGRVLKSWEGIDAGSYTAEATFGKDEIKDYSYFYLRVTQADKDIAVTAPVWVGAPVLTGVASLTSGTAMPVVGEPIELTASLFNNEETAATLTSISYAIKDGTVISSATPGSAIPSMGLAEHKISYTPTKAGAYTIVVTAVITVGGKTSTYTQSVNVKVLDPSTMPYIGIDSSHFNEYVSGNYKDSMGNFGLLAFSKNVRTNLLKTSADLIAACSNPKYKMLVLTVPSRRDGIVLRDPYLCYTDDEIAAIKAFAENGGAIVVAGWSDLYENYGGFPTDASKKDDHMAAQQNKLLAAIGSQLRISDDAILDDSHNSTNTAANSSRLYLSNYNFENPLNNGIVFDAGHIYDGQNNTYSQVFSQYGGTTIYAVDGEGKATTTLPASVSPIVSGFDTSYSSDKDGDGLGGATTPKYPVTQGNEGVKNCVLVAASETVEHANGKKSMVVVSGGAFMSNFEIQSQAEGDNNAQLGYSNYNILENLIEMVNPPVITDIAAVQAAPEGQTFTVEGLITANASGFDPSTAFFDCTYVQDATGGVNAFPVAGNYQVGQKVRITGVTSSYGGERQLAVTGIKVLDATPAAVEPKTVTTKQVSTGAVLGQLVKIEGVVVSFSETEGATQTIVVRDSTGCDARIFIDGYITTDKDAALKASLAVGNKITAVGLASYDNFFDGAPNRIRIRDRADIVCTSEKPELPAGVSYATITVPLAGFAAGMAGAQDDAFMREGIVFADPTDTGAVAVSGTLAYKSGFTGFWENNAAMQSGNFLALRLALPNYPGLSPVLTFGDKTITVPDGHTEANGNPYYDFIKRIDSSNPNFTIVVDLDGVGTAYTPTTYTFDLSGLTLTPAPSTGGSTGGSTSSKTETVTNPDGSVTKTETVTKTDSSTGAKVETVTATTTAKDGTVTKTQTIAVAGGRDGVTATASVDTAADGKKSMTAEIEAKEGETSVKLPAAITEAAKGAGSVRVTVDVGGAAVTLDAAAMAAIAKVGGSTPAISVTPAKADKLPESVKGAVAYELTVGGKSVDFGAGKVTVTMAYTKKDENKSVAVFLVGEDGELSRMSGVSYKDGKVTFNTPHWSVYAIVEEEALPFTDVSESAWYYGAVRVTFESKLFSGISGTRFAPDMDMTRGMLWTVLYRQAGSPAVEGADSAIWYSAAQKWAVEKGISDGTSPETGLTREQLVTTLYRYAGSPETSGMAAQEFPDYAQVSDWANSAMLWAVQEGLLQGADGKLLPQAGASRAQVATILVRFIENEAK